MRTRSPVAYGVDVADAAGQCRTARGFTLVEVMIAVIIVGILSALAYPAFLDAIRKGRRAEAFSALTALQQSQERWRSNNAAYTTAAAASAPNGLGIPATTASGYYAIGVSAADAVSYTATATAVSGTSQAADGDCKVLGAQARQGGTLRYGSGSTSINWGAADPDAGRCWAR